MPCGQKHPSSQFWLSHTGSSPRRRAHVSSQGWPQGLYTSPLSHIIATIINSQWRFPYKTFVFVKLMAKSLARIHVKDPINVSRDSNGDNCPSYISEHSMVCVRPIYLLEKKIPKLAKYYISILSLKVLPKYLIEGYSISDLKVCGSSV